MATRPWSFPASAIPVAVTLAYLYSLECEIDWLLGIWTIINIVLFHAAGNTWSDYMDFKKSVDREDTIGGTSITSGLFEANEIKRLSFALLSAALLFGLVLLFFKGMPLLYLGVAGAMLSLIYPWMKYRALGDLDIFLTYSLLPILGTSYVATGQFNFQTLWLTVPIGMITVGILHINNIRDIEPDRRAGISTFAMLAGAKASLVIYAVEILFPFVWIAAGILAGLFPVMSLFVFIAFKIALDNVKQAFKYRTEGMKALVSLDENTAKLQLAFGLVLAITFLIKGVLA